MNLLVFGASGGTGRQLVAQALRRDYHVTAFVRRPEKITTTDARLRVVQGDVADAAAVARAIPGHDAVISALGVGRPLHPDPVVVEGVRHVVRAMEQCGVQRLIYQSFTGVSDSRPRAGLLVRLIAARLLRHEIADHETKEQIIRDSGLDWTIVRAPKLTDGPATGEFRAGDMIAARSPFPTLARADVADFMLRQASDTAFVRKAVSVLP